MFALVTNSAQKKMTGDQGRRIGDRTAQIINQVAHTFTNGDKSNLRTS